MTHTYALKRLLEHGSLTRAEMFEITGWKGNIVDSVLQNMLIYGIVQSLPRKAGEHKTIYELTCHATEPK